jgi:hypothetical protein
MISTSPAIAGVYGGRSEDKEEAVAAAHSSASGSIVAQEKAKLQKALRRVGLILLTACAIVAIDTLAYTASVGGQAITSLVLSFFLFLIPYGLLVGARDDVQRRGRPVRVGADGLRAVAPLDHASLYCISNPIWIGGTLTAIAALNTFRLGDQVKTLIDPDDPL